ncbi:hypothetical protein DXG01_010516 [Tephrocybe rancida]|nr:hypothetical protein DXG01_010516 [Tephrocybe rancida]
MDDLPPLSPLTEPPLSPPADSSLSALIELIPPLLLSPTGLPLVDGATPSLKRKRFVLDYVDVPSKHCKPASKANVDGTGSVGNVQPGSALPHKRPSSNPSPSKKQATTQVNHQKPTARRVSAPSYDVRPQKVPLAPAYNGAPPQPAAAARPQSAPSTAHFSCTRCPTHAARPVGASAPNSATGKDPSAAGSNKVPIRAFPPIPKKKPTEAAQGSSSSSLSAIRATSGSAEASNNASAQNHSVTVESSVAVPERPAPSVGSSLPPPPPPANEISHDHPINNVHQSAASNSTSASTLIPPQTQPTPQRPDPSTSIAGGSDQAPPPPPPEEPCPPPPPTDPNAATSLNVSSSPTKSAGKSSTLQEQPAPTTNGTAGQPSRNSSLSALAIQAAERSNISQANGGAPPYAPLTPPLSISRSPRPPAPAKPDADTNSSTASAPPMDPAAATVNEQLLLTIKELSDGMQALHTHMQESQRWIKAIAIGQRLPLPAAFEPIMQMHAPQDPPWYQLRLVALRCTPNIMIDHDTLQENSLDKDKDIEGNHSMVNPPVSPRGSGVGCLRYVASLSELSILLAGVDEGDPDSDDREDPIPVRDYGRYPYARHQTTADDPRSPAWGDDRPQYRPHENERSPAQSSTGGYDDRDRDRRRGEDRDTTRDQGHSYAYSRNQASSSHRAADPYPHRQSYERSKSPVQTPERNASPPPGDVQPRRQWGYNDHARSPSRGYGYRTYSDVRSTARSPRYRSYERSPT